MRKAVGADGNLILMVSCCECARVGAAYVKNNPFLGGPSDEYEQ